MATAQPSIGPRTRRRGHGLDRSDITLKGDGGIDDDVSQLGMVCRRKSPRLNTTNTSSGTGADMGVALTPHQPPHQPNPVSPPHQATLVVPRPPPSPTITCKVSHPPTVAPQTAVTMQPQQPTEPLQAPIVGQGMDDDVSQFGMVSRRKSPRLNTTDTSSNTGADIRVVTLPKPRTIRSKTANPSPSSATARPPPPIPVNLPKHSDPESGDLTHVPEVVLPPHQPNPVSPTAALQTAVTTEPQQPAEPLQAPARPRRKLNIRPKPRGCDSTGRRKSARLNPIDLTTLSPYNPQTLPPERTESSGIVKSKICKKNPQCDPSLWRTWLADRPWLTSRGAASQSPQVQMRADVAAVATEANTDEGQTEEEPAAQSPPCQVDTEFASDQEEPSCQDPNGNDVEPQTQTEGPEPAEQNSEQNLYQPAAQSPPCQVDTEFASDQEEPSRQDPNGNDVEPQTQTEGPEPAEQNSEQSSDCGIPPRGVFQDDGSRRCRLRLPLRAVPDAHSLSGLELDVSALGVAAGNRKRSRKGKEIERRNVRGLAKPRAPVGQDLRPVLMVVGDAEFRSELNCTKVPATIRLLTLANIPGAYRSYNMFPSSARIEILKGFLQRYSWGEGESVGRCLDVFENIAAEAYSRVMTDVRRLYNEKIGLDKELWKDHCPRWCKSAEIWKGLCDIWSNPKWEKESSTNRANKLKKGRGIVCHVGGSRSSFRHKQVMIAEKGAPVALKEVFDRTHMKNTPRGKLYVNSRAHKVAAAYDALKESRGNELEEEAIWELAAEGEDKRGRLFGFGNKSRTSKANRELEAVEASASDPTKSTATSAEDCDRRFTREEVANLVAEKVAAARISFASEIAAQEQRHKAELEKVMLDTSLSKAYFDVLFKHAKITPPNIADLASQSMSGGGDVRGGEENQA